ncbi:cysteine hydrolase [Arthrobacter bambusae]|uniref:cysteine hydrolase family protein n=1 Tax=Arthrobacter bambusae TaxID=1338426 RepID=UPI001F50A798|nr:cysteine hydrolase [Arthrobacter bambusae]MCI0142096.1 cysteine hydrolase [Arthrobacter bambusae]
MELNPERTAVIAVHCQGDIVSGDGAFAPFFHDQVVSRNVISKIGNLLDSARESGMTVIYTRVAFKPDFSDLNANSPLLKVVEQAGCLKEGTGLAEIVPELAPGGEDVVITHQRVGGFVLELTAILEGRGIDTVVFAGVATNASVESSARVATDAGYRVIIAEDACSAATPEAHKASIESLGLLAEISTTAEIVGASAPQTV